MAEKPSALSPGGSAKGRSSVSGEKTKFAEDKPERSHDRDRPKFADVGPPKVSDPKAEKSPSVDKSRKDKGEHHGAGDASSPATPPPPVNLAATIPSDVLEKVKTWKVKQAAISQGKTQGKATSKTHPFKPPASIQEALDFLKSQGVRNCTLVFTNSSAMGFADGQFIDFDNFDEDDD